MSFKITVNAVSSITCSAILFATACNNATDQTPQASSTNTTLQERVRSNEDTIEQLRQIVNTQQTTIAALKSELATAIDASSKSTKMLMEISTTTEKTSSGLEAQAIKLDSLETNARESIVTSAKTLALISDLSSRLDLSSTSITDIDQKLNNLTKSVREYRQELSSAAPTTLTLSPDDTTNHLLLANTGPVIVATSKLTPKSGGSSGLLIVTNPSNITLSGGTCAVAWSKPMPSADADWKDWLASYQTTEITIPLLEPGARVFAAMNLSNLEPSQIGSVDISEMRFNEIQTAKPKLESLFKTSIELDPTAGGYHIIWTHIGPLTVSVSDVTAFADGSQVRLEIGNITNAELRDGSFKLTWGPREPSGLTGFAEWVGSLRSQQFSLPDIEAGRYNAVTIKIPAVPPSGLGYLEINDMMFKGTSLLVNRANK
jgi:hypothetical protein